MIDQLDRMVRLLNQLHLRRIARSVGRLTRLMRSLQRLTHGSPVPAGPSNPNPEGADQPARSADSQPQPGDFGPAQGGYYSASSPDAALGGKGIFGPDATNSRDQVGQSALNGEKLGKAS
jgi:hypothetical protein